VQTVRGKLTVRHACAGRDLVSLERFVLSLSLRGCLERELVLHALTLGLHRAVVLKARLPTLTAQSASAAPSFQIPTAPASAVRALISAWLCGTVSFLIGFLRQASMFGAEVRRIAITPPASAPKYFPLDTVHLLPRTCATTAPSRRRLLAQVLCNGPTYCLHSLFTA
jgi:hypothetical protein